MRWLCPLIDADSTQIRDQPMFVKALDDSHSRQTWNREGYEPRSCGSWSRRLVPGKSLSIEPGGSHSFLVAIALAGQFTIDHEWSVIVDPYQMLIGGAGSAFNVHNRSAQSGHLLVMEWDWVDFRLGLINQGFPLPRLFRSIARSRFESDLRLLMLGKEEIPIELDTAIFRLLENAMGRDLQIQRKLAQRRFGINLDLLPALYRTTDHIRSSYAVGVEIEELENIFGRSRNTLFRGFKAAYGLTPHQAVNMTRLGRAIELMMHKNRDINQLHQAVGFQARSTLSRLFKSQLGYAAADLKKMLLEHETYSDALISSLIAWDKETLSRQMQLLAGLKLST